MTYFENPAFQIKPWLLAISGLNALAFTMFEHRILLAMPNRAATPILAKSSAALSLTLWFAMIFFGRLITFQAAG